MEYLGIPIDVVENCGIVIVYGKTKARIENFVSMLEYNENIIKVRTRQNIITIEGSKLKIDSYCKDVMLIKGSIDNIKYV